MIYLKVFIFYFMWVYFDWNISVVLLNKALIRIALRQY